MDHDSLVYKVDNLVQKLSIEFFCINSIQGLSQTSFSLYLHNQWTNFHKQSCARKSQMRAIYTYVGGTRATIND